MTDQQASNITPSQTGAGLNLNLNIRNAKPGTLSYALNAVVQGVDGQGISYQDEQGNTFYVSWTDGYRVVGKHVIIEQDKAILWLANPSTGDSEIGLIYEGSYRKLINDPAIGLSVDRPIHKAFHRTVDCQTEVYWTDGGPRKFINIDELPFKKIPDPSGCGFITTSEFDPNQILVQPNYQIPTIETTEVSWDGELTAGTYQFAVGYATKNSYSYTSYHSITNPLPIFDESRITLEFNYTVNKAINLTITGIDITGLYEYINLAVIKTVNNISSFELVGTYKIEKDNHSVVYTGQKIGVLTENDIFEKFPVYTKAEDIYSVQGVLGWKGMTTQERISYQEIANKIKLQWQSWRLKKGAYKDPLHAEKHRGYMRDEVYPLEFVPLLKNGYQCDRFHIPGRIAVAYDLELVSNRDVISDEATDCDHEPKQGKERWKVYNTATKTAYDPSYNPDDPCYEGPFEYGEFAYWQSEEEYPCGQGLPEGPIRHFKIPDEKVSPRFKEEYIYPIGIRIDIASVAEAIKDSSLTPEQKENIIGFKIVRGNRAGGQKSVIAKGLINNVGKYTYEDTDYYFPNYGEGNDLQADPFLGSSQSGVDEDDSTTYKRRLNAFGEESKNRFTLLSPDTGFYKPTLGNILKMESVEEGSSESHFVQVKNCAKYNFLSLAVYSTAIGIGAAAGALGIGIDGYDSQALIEAFQAVIDIVNKVIPKVNYAYQYNGIGNYSSSTPVENSGNKQRRIDLGFYLEPGMVKRGENHTINNFQRESSVYLRTTETLPFSHEQAGEKDISKWILGEQGNCDSVSHTVSRHISSYYASIKRHLPNQWGQLYSYEAIDTGFQWVGDLSKTVTERYQTIFGGDTFISRYAVKRKLPFFIDHRVGSPDNADISYPYLANVAYPLYWMSTDYSIGKVQGQSFIKKVEEKLQEIFGVKANNYDCRTNKFFYQNGKFYLFHYGIPYFYCESEVNCDLRQAFNDKEGEFYPHIGDGIPDEWLQEVNTTIKQDNTYHYNKTYSKQNKENLFTSLPVDYNATCNVYDPYLTVYSDQDNWRIYRPESKFIFPDNRGYITSIDGITNDAVLVRYETSSQLYNVLLTVQTSNPQAAYLGNDTLFRAAPPIDLARVDGGYIGSQHKMYVRTPFGDVFTDAKRGDIFILRGTQPQEISTPEVQQFFQDNLYVADDNHFNGKGITGVYDINHSRLLLTKLDGIKSFTLSYNFITQSWVSFHSYLPNFYMEHPTTFYSSNQAGVWLHGNDSTLYHSFYGSAADYIIEYPVVYPGNDELFHYVADYSQVLQHFQDGSYVYTDDWFTSAILYNDQQCSGVRKLNPKPKNSLMQAMAFPKYNPDSIDIVYTKSNSMYNFNTVWALNTPGQPIWKPSQINLSVYKDLNQSAMDYSKRSFNKAPLMAKNLKIRLINSRTDRRIISNFLFSESQQSIK